MNATITLRMDDVTLTEVASAASKIIALGLRVECLNAYEPEARLDNPAEAPTAELASLPTTDADAKKEAALKKRRDTAAKKKAADVKAKAEVAAMEDTADDLLGGAVTLDDLKGAVRAKVEADGIDAVKTIFAEYGAVTLNGIDKDKYGELLAKLQE